MWTSGLRSLPSPSHSSPHQRQDRAGRAVVQQRGGRGHDPAQEAGPGGDVVDPPGRGQRRDGQAICKNLLSSFSCSLLCSLDRSVLWYFSHHDVELFAAKLASIGVVGSRLLQVTSGSIIAEGKLLLYPLIQPYFLDTIALLPSPPRPWRSTHISGGISSQIYPAVYIHPNILAEHLPRSQTFPQYLPAHSSAAKQGNRGPNNLLIL